MTIRSICAMILAIVFNFGLSSRLALAAPGPENFALGGSIGDPLHPDLAREILDTVSFGTLIAIAKSGENYATGVTAEGAAKSAAGRASLSREEAGTFWLIDLVRNENNYFGELIESAASERVLGVLTLTTNPTELFGELSPDDRVLLIRKVLNWKKRVLTDSLKVEFVLRLGTRSEISEAIKQASADDPVVRNVKFVLNHDSAYEVFKARKVIRLKDVNPILGTGPDLLGLIEGLPGGTKAFVPFIANTSKFNCEMLFSSSQ